MTTGRGARLEAYCGGSPAGTGQAWLSQEPRVAGAVFPEQSLLTVSRASAMEEKYTKSRVYPVNRILIVARAPEKGRK